MNLSNSECAAIVAMILLTILFVAVPTMLSQQIELPGFSKWR